MLVLLAFQSVRFLDCASNTDLALDNLFIWILTPSQKRFFKHQTPFWISICIQSSMCFDSMLGQHHSQPIKIIIVYPSISLCCQQWITFNKVRHISMIGHKQNQRRYLTWNIEQIRMKMMNLYCFLLILIFNSLVP